MFFPESVCIDGVFWGVFGVIETVSEVEERGGDVGMADEGVVGDAALWLVGVADDEGDAEAGFVDGGFGSREGDAVVGGEDDEGFVVEVGLFEHVDEVGEAGIDAGDALVVLGEFGAAFGGVWEEWRDDDLVWLVEGFGDAGVLLLVGEVAEGVGLMWEVEVLVGAVWVDEADVEEEGFGVVGEDDGACLFDGGDGVAGFCGELLVVVEDGVGGDVVFADEGGAVAGFSDDLWEGEGDGVGEAGEVAGVVHVAVVAVGVVV